MKVCTRCHLPRVYNRMLTLTKKERLLLGLIRNSETGCWEWVEGALPTGYGVLWDGEENAYIHRVSYQEFVGPIPENKEIHHICFNRRCGNPEHLRVVFHRENIRVSNAPMGINARKKICRRGHPLIGRKADVRMMRGHRVCRICDAIRAKEYRVRAGGRGKRVHVRGAS